MAKKKLSFLPQVIDIQLYAGDGSGIRFTLTDSTGAVLPLTGDMKAQIRAAREAVDPSLADFSIVDTEFSDGIVVIYLTGDQTHDLISDDETFVGVWDLEWTPTGGEPVTLVQGKVECFPDVTH